MEATDTIDQFLNEWVEKSIAYYRGVRDKYLALQIENEENVKKYRVENNIPDWKHLSMESKNYNDEEKYLMDAFGGKTAYIRYRSNISCTGEYEHRWLEPIQKMLEKEAKAKKEIIISRVEKIAGKNVEKSNLWIGANGELNGSVTGELGTATVETIYAGGYNIQRLHFRVLVKKLK